MNRNGRSRGCRGIVLGCCWVNRVSRSQARQERIRLMGGERLFIYTQYRRLKVYYYSILNVFIVMTVVANLHEWSSKCRQSTQDLREEFRG